MKRRHRSGRTAQWKQPGEEGRSFCGHREDLPEMEGENGGWGRRRKSEGKCGCEIRKRMKRRTEREYERGAVEWNRGGETE